VKSKGGSSYTWNAWQQVSYQDGVNTLVPMQVVESSGPEHPLFAPPSPRSGEDIPSRFFLPFARKRKRGWSATKECESEKFA